MKYNRPVRMAVIPDVTIAGIRRYAMKEGADDAIASRYVADEGQISSERNQLAERFQWSRQYPSRSLMNCARASPGEVEEAESASRERSDRRPP